MAGSICVYTALFGGYDGLLDQPVAADSVASFICFTDDPSLVSDTWEVRLVEPTFLQDPVRNARLLKILGHDDLSQFDATLWIDASVVLLRPPEEVIEQWLVDGAEMALATHSYREQVVDEFDEIIKLNYDDRARIYEQLTDYAVAHPEILEARPLWTGIIARRWTPSVTAAMRTWANHVLRYSRRDQLSVVVALSEEHLSYRTLPLDNFESEVHRWPVIPTRRVSQGKAAPLPAGPLVADLRRALLRVDELTATLVEQADEVAAARAGTAEKAVLAAELERLTREARASSVELAAAEARLHAQSGIRGAVRNLRSAVAHRLIP